MVPSFLHRAARLAGALALALLAGCGGGGGATSSTSTQTCDLETEQSWVRTMVRDLYYWYAQSPDPEPAGYTTAEAYFKALLYAALDRWSYVSTAEADAAYYQEGTEMGYGARYVWDAQRRLRVAYVEDASPLARAGLGRGAIVTLLNGRTPEAIANAGDWTAVLNPPQAGVPLTLVWQDPVTGAQSELVASSALVTLNPVRSALLPQPDGGQVGYLLFNNHIATTSAPLVYAFEGFKAAGISDLVLDLRYNGGGFEYIANQLASQIAGAAAAGQVFASHTFNDKHPERNFDARFATVPESATLGLRRVFVLSGGGTCSASELVINGIKPFVEVIQIGTTSCGKPYGMIRQSQCGRAYYPILFETRNAVGAGGYVSGIAPTCRVGDDFAHALGDPAEARLAAALNYRITGACPVVADVQSRFAVRAWEGMAPAPERGFGANIVAR